MDFVGSLDWKCIIQHPRNKSQGKNLCVIALVVPPLLRSHFASLYSINDSRMSFSENRIKKAASRRLGTCGRFMAGGLWQYQARKQGRKRYTWLGIKT